MENNQTTGTAPLAENVEPSSETAKQESVTELPQEYEMRSDLTIPDEAHLSTKMPDPVAQQPYPVAQTTTEGCAPQDQLIPIIPIESELHQPQPEHAMNSNPSPPPSVDFKHTIAPKSEQIIADVKEGSVTPPIQLPSTVLTTEEFSKYLVQQTNRDFIKAAELIPEDALEQQRSASEFVQSLIAQGIPEPSANHAAVPAELLRPKRKNDNKKCTCHNTQCLKRYCVCFNSGRMCSPECSCTNCRNREGFEAEIQQAINRVKEIRSPYAPPPKDPNVVITPSAIGCRCKKECRKNYCDCRRSNHCCSKLCTCENCCNDKYMGDLPEVTEAMKREERMMRKKNRTASEHSISQNINDYQMIGDYGSDYTPQIQQFGVEFQSQFTGM